MKRLFQTILLAALLGAAPPAMAQTLHFGFGMGIDQGDDPDARFLPRRLCILTDRGLRNTIADQGYKNIFLNVPTGRYVQARATRGEWVYLLRVNACTGLIIDRERLRRAK
ncbi:MAG TPA: hypothetical protein PK286_06860 [Devosia sp.]|nr:hypothetical protein [Devosia sp.]